MTTWIPIKRYVWRARSRKTTFWCLMLEVRSYFIDSITCIFTVRKIKTPTIFAWLSKQEQIKNFHELIFKIKMSLVLFQVHPTHLPSKFFISPLLSPLPLSLLIPNSTVTVMPPWCLEQCLVAMEIITLKKQYNSIK